MNKKEKFIGLAGYISGIVTGGIIGYYIADLTIVRTIFFIAFIACVGILALLTYATVCEVRAEDRRKAWNNTPANWGFDKSFEN